jgi:hypothetical protein
MCAQAYHFYFCLYANGAFSIFIFVCKIIKSNYYVLVQLFTVKDRVSWVRTVYLHEIIIFKTRKAMVSLNPTLYINIVSLIKSTNVIILKHTKSSALSIT